MSIRDVRISVGKNALSGMTRSIAIVVKLASEIVCIEPYLGDSIKLILLWELPLP